MAVYENVSLPQLTPQETARLKAVADSRSVSILRSRRASMLQDLSGGVPVCEIARAYRTGCVEVERLIDKALQQEILVPRGAAEKKHAARTITNEMVAWIRDVSFQNPSDLGYACGQWSGPLLAKHVRGHCRAVGHDALARLGSGEVSRLLAENDGTWV